MENFKRFWAWLVDWTARLSRTARIVLLAVGGVLIVAVVMLVTVKPPVTEVIRDEVRILDPCVIEILGNRLVEVQYPTAYTDESEDSSYETMSFMPVRRRRGTRLRPWYRSHTFYKPKNAHKFWVKNKSEQDNLMTWTHGGFPMYIVKRKGLFGMDYEFYQTLPVKYEAMYQQCLKNRSSL